MKGGGRRICSKLSLRLRQLCTVAGPRRSLLDRRHKFSCRRVGHLRSQRRRNEYKIAQVFERSNWRATSEEDYMVPSRSNVCVSGSTTDSHINTTLDCIGSVKLLALLVQSDDSTNIKARGETRSGVCPETTGCMTLNQSFLKSGSNRSICC